CAATVTDVLPPAAVSYGAAEARIRDDDGDRGAYGGLAATGPELALLLAGPAGGGGSDPGDGGGGCGAGGARRAPSLLRADCGRATSARVRAARAEARARARTRAFRGGLICAIRSTSDFCVRCFFCIRASS